MSLNLATRNLDKSPEAKQLARDYIVRKEIPQLMEAITAGLLHHRPEEPVLFVQEAIREVKSARGYRVRWNSFIEWTPPSSRPNTAESKVRFQLGNATQHHIEKDNYSHTSDSASRASSGYRSLSRSSQI